MRAGDVAQCAVLYSRGFMQTLASGISYVDLQHTGRPRVIASGVLHGPAGVAIVDPGPSSTLPRLWQELEAAGIREADVTTLLLTHIHLDHAGATGTMVRANPKLRVYVHEKGAPHLIDPSKLVASAGRLYADRMQTLWGPIDPVPAAAIDALQGGERLAIAGRTWEVEYTPGHASHHVSYFDRNSGIAFVGDVAGVKINPRGVVMPPTPPPDIDLEAWEESLHRIEAWRPDTLFLTHFGPYAPFDAHLAELREYTALTANLVKTSLSRDGDDASREKWFAEELMRALRRRLSEEDARAYEVAARFDLNYRGLARYWKKRGSPKPEA